MKPDLESPPSNLFGQAWGVAVQAHRSDVWRQKIAFLRGSRDLELATEGGMLRLSRPAYPSHVRGIPVATAVTGIRHVEISWCKRSKGRVGKEVADSVDRDAWRALRAWVQGEGFPVGQLTIHNRIYPHSRHTPICAILNPIIPTQHQNAYSGWPKVRVHRGSPGYYQNIFVNLSK